MATPFSCVCATPIPSSSTLSSNRVSPDLTRTKPTSGSSSASWWAPIFGWSPNPDYIGNSSSSSAIRTGSSRETSGQVSDPVMRSKFRPGSFTEDKAKELRKLTVQSSNFHDIMYHSAIASRLASDVSGR